MRRLRRDGVALFYDEAGGGELPLVFVHGWCCDHTYFAPQFEHFRRKHRVVAVDLRGHGQSDKPLFRGLAGPEWRFVELPTGHWPMFSRPEDLAELLLDLPSDTPGR
jgi:pimeloyl-ACP methyl ester carboxylesterase